MRNPHQNSLLNKCSEANRLDSHSMALPSHNDSQQSQFRGHGPRLHLMAFGRECRMEHPLELLRLGSRWRHSHRDWWCRQQMLHLCNTSTFYRFGKSHLVIGMLLVLWLHCWLHRLLNCLMMIGK